MRTKEVMVVKVCGSQQNTAKGTHPGEVSKSMSLRIKQEGEVLTL